MTRISVLRDRYVKGWPRHAEGDRAYVLPVGAALEREYSTDAHFVAYRAPNARRLTREAIDVLGSVELTCVVFDVDCPAVHGTSEPAPESWRRELRESVLALGAVHPGPFYYETRGGGRIVYQQAQPTVLRTQADAQSWTQGYAVAIAYLQRCFGIVADPACGDWQRLYRLPRATRDAKPENWPISGDPNAIGSLLIEASHQDVATAQRSSKAFREHRVLDFAPSSAGGDGLLFHALRARGAIVREHSSGALVIRCPHESEHSTGRTGDGSTLLYRPTVGEQVGAIHCLHAHCSSRTVRDWLRCFSEPELEAARAAAGIKRAA